MKVLKIKVKVTEQGKVSLFRSITLKYICKVLLEGSIDASYDENTADVFEYIDSTKRFNTF